MGTTTAISIDRFRRTRRAALQAGAVAADTTAHPLEGTVLGVLMRRYGLMSSEDTIVVGEVVATSGDLAVADRLAFVASMERRVPVAVIEFNGWYVACTTDRVISSDEVSALRPAVGAPRIMSLATDRGITPALGPLCA